MYKHIGHVCFTFVFDIQNAMDRPRATKPMGKIMAIRTGLPNMAMSVTAAMNPKKRNGNLQSIHQKNKTNRSKLEGKLS